MMHDGHERPAGRLSAGGVLILCLAVAVAAGAAEVAVAAVRRLASDELLHVSRAILWMAPVGELALLAPVALVGYGLGRFMPRVVTLRSLLCALLFVASISVLLFTGVLHDVAVLLLAAGIAWRGAAAAGRAPDGTARLARRVVAVGTVLFVLLAASLHGGLAWQERRAVVALPAAKADAPNVILLIWDTVRAVSLSLYGHGRTTTPNLDRLAQRGVVFDRAIATSPWTLPSHASMLTGRLPHETGVSWTRPLGPEPASLPELLAAHGYRTAGFSANLLYVTWESGLTRGFTRFEDYRVTPGQVLLSTALGRRLVTGKHGWGVGVGARLVGFRDQAGRKRADDVNASLLRWIDRTESDDARPWFALLNYFDAHLPYEPPEPFRSRFGPARTTEGMADRVRALVQRRGRWEIGPTALAAEVAAYEASIAYLDDRLERLLAELERRGELANTIIAVVADHGEEFGEHGDYEHGSNLYAEQLHVPLVLVYPQRIPAGLRVAEPVSIRDLPATILDMIALDPATGLAGESLAGHWSAPSRAGHAVAELTPGLRPEERMRALVLGDHHYIRNTNGSEELYDWRSDAGLRHDLMLEPAGPVVAAWMSRKLDDVLRGGASALRAGAGCAAPDPAVTTVHSVASVRC